MKSLKNRTLEQNLPWILAGGASIGLLAAFVLTLEKIALLQDPGHQLSCSINPVLSCGSIIMSDQASAFGFPNPFLGIAAFAVLITIGVAMLAGAKFKRWFWRGLQLGTIFGIGFVAWLIWESLYDIGALCLYCMAVWSITWPIFWYTTLYNLRKKNIPTPKSLKGVVAFAQRHHADILIAWYVLVIALIIVNFWYYWSTLV
jgi:uncharacterized membrane protein